MSYEDSLRGVEEAEEVPPCVGLWPELNYLLAECSIYIARNLSRGLLFILTAASQEQYGH